MKLNIAENIRKYRRQRGITQENLAEILGVTVGAVSKWENGSSVPDILLIMELADFFEISTDVLLGFDSGSRSIAEYCDSIDKYKRERDFDSAAKTADKALARFPNAFRVAHCSANAYMVKGIESGNEKDLNKALSLFSRSLELLEQNVETDIDSVSICNDMAEIYLILGETDKAIEELKAHNIGGCNNSKIAYILATYKRVGDSALPMLSESLLNCIVELNSISTGFLNVYCDSKKYSEALDMLDWYIGLIDGLKGIGPDTALDKVSIVYRTEKSGIYLELGRTEDAKNELAEVKRRADRYNKCHIDGFESLKFYTNTKERTAFSSYGDSDIYEVVQKVILEDDDASRARELLSLWKEVCAESGVE